MNLACTTIWLHRTEHLKIRQISSVEMVKLRAKSNSEKWAINNEWQKSATNNGKISNADNKPIVSQVNDSDWWMTGRDNAHASANKAAIRIASSHHLRTRSRVRLVSSRLVRNSTDGKTTRLGSRLAIKCNAIGTAIAAIPNINVAFKKVMVDSDPFLPGSYFGSVSLVHNLPHLWTLRN